MRFTYEGYVELLKKLLNNNYQCSSYHDYKKDGKVVILRHDIDMDLDCAVKFAEIEHDLGVFSTYFILLKTDFYNIASKKSKACVDRIKTLGHEIGLHFDEASMGVGGGYYPI